ncbi:MAG TPA: DinB family protein [Candidatus Limnocylindria bacterium]|nr:DinB family protein [Candidatus Limnocylindria bacterium]
MSPSELTTDQVAVYLAATSELIDGELEALGDDSAWHFDPNEWCANQVVGHLVEAEKRGFAGRIREILAGTKKTSAWDQVAVARERNDCARMGQSLWMEFMGVRNDSLRLVRSLAPGDLGKGIEHPKAGHLTVRDLLHEWIHHDRNHTRQLLQIAQERVWPHMGNSQKFKGE